jgi:DNA invertase Pin-like site-specific DNA recombinase
LSGRAALYHRVSTLDQDPTLARAELREAAARHRFAVALEIEETGSGARNSRPGLQRVMQAARRGEIDVVMTWKLDRFGRSVLDLLTNIRTLEASGVRFIAVTQGLHIRPEGDAVSRMMLTMLAAVTEFERDLIRERTRLGLAKARAEGKHLGRPLGSRNANAIVRSVHVSGEVKRLRAENRSWSYIAHTLGVAATTCRRAAVKAS